MTTFDLAWLQRTKKAEIDKDFREYLKVKDYVSCGVYDGDYPYIYLFKNKENVMAVPAWSKDALVWDAGVEYDIELFRKICYLEEEDEITASVVCSELIEHLQEDSGYNLECL